MGKKTPEFNYAATFDRLMAEHFGESFTTEWNLLVGSFGGYITERANGKKLTKAQTRVGHTISAALVAARKRRTMTTESVEQIVAEMRGLSNELWGASSAWHNQTKDLADRLEDAMKRRAAIGEGFVLVPREPTHEMLHKIMSTSDRAAYLYGNDSARASILKFARSTYRDLIAATPPAQEAAPINVNPIDSKSIGAGGGSDE